MHMGIYNTSGSSFYNLQENNDTCKKKKHASSAPIF